MAANDVRTRFGDDDGKGGVVHPAWLREVHSLAEAATQVHLNVDTPCVIDCRPRGGGLSAP
jgi:hypothetical protein